MVLYGLVRRRAWAWWLAVAAGAGLVIWIITEVAFLGYLPDIGGALQIGMGVLGVLIRCWSLCCGLPGAISGWERRPTADALLTDAPGRVRGATADGPQIAGRQLCWVLSTGG